MCLKDMFSSKLYTDSWLMADIEIRIPFPSCTRLCGCVLEIGIRASTCEPGLVRWSDIFFVTNIDELGGIQLLESHNPLHCVERLAFVGRRSEVAPDLGELDLTFNGVQRCLRNASRGNIRKDLIVIHIVKVVEPVFDTSNTEIALWPGIVRVVNGRGNKQRGRARWQYWFKW
jgi:hypothetical protein